MKIGVFDSGLGGLAIARAIMDRLPMYDYLYLGDTKRVPYGGRSQETIHEFTSQALDYLFGNGCELVILACNTASSEALRRSQQEYLPANYPNRRVLGVIIPVAEIVSELVSRKDDAKIGVLATRGTVDSQAYPREIARRRPQVEVVQKAAPLLVPLVENDGLKYVDPILEDYLDGFDSMDAVILGCTHYCLLKGQVRSMVNVPVISQDEIIPEKLADYLERHPEIESKLGRTGSRSFHVTDLTGSYGEFVQRLTGEHLHLEKVSI